MLESFGQVGGDVPEYFSSDSSGVFFMVKLLYENCGGYKEMRVQRCMHQIDFMVGHI